MVDAHDSIHVRFSLGHLHVAVVELHRPRPDVLSVHDIVAKRTMLVLQPRDVPPTC
jgi:hypothetical protein